mmetsp:Transcript_15595/g.11352  ORF Transcript_15595/g.11352 Transcript_15595/m.11352 type:complete len:81 (-) Transcript_15595:123-365(-)
MDTINNSVLNFKLLDGFSAETSGGLFILLKRSQARDFIQEAYEKYGQTVWEIGEVTKGSRKVHFRKDMKIHTIKESFLRD